MADFELTCLLHILSVYASEGFVLHAFKSTEKFCGLRLKI